MLKDSEKLAMLDREAVRRGGFSEFIRIAWSQIEPGADLIWSNHIDLISAHCEGLLRCEMRDLVINVPPGTSKSTLLSILFPAWAWTVDPSLKFLYTSYDESLTNRFADRALRLMCSDWFKARWPEVEILDGERANQSLYENTKGGVRISTMMGGRATGKHCDILVVDDPHKPDDLDGEIESVKKAVTLAWRRWVDTFSTRRANPKTFRRVCIMQRLHEDDIAGQMLRAPGTVHLCLPMLYEPKRHCKTQWGEDWRTQEGELLVPTRFDQATIDADRARMSPRTFAAQHQQRPAAMDGNLLLRAYFKNRWSMLPPALRMYLSVDANLKARADADSAVIQCWGVHKANYYCIDQVDGHWSFGALMGNIKMMKQKWPMVTNILIEDKANGTAVISALKNEVPGIIEINPQGGKRARVEAVEWLLRANNVLFPSHKAPWIEELIDQAAAFPAGSHDDMVDALSQFLVWAMTNGKGLNNWLKAMRAARNGATFR